MSHNEIAFAVAAQNDGAHMGTIRDLAHWGHAICNDLRSGTQEATEAEKVSQDSQSPSGVPMLTLPQATHVVADAVTTCA